MQVQALDLDSCEVTPNRGAAAKFDSIVAAHEASAAEGLSQVIIIDLSILCFPFIYPYFILCFFLCFCVLHI